MAKEKTTIKISYENIVELKDIFSEINDEKTIPAIALIDEIIYCGELMQKLKKDVEEKGTMIVMQNGPYPIDRINPALTMYHQTLKSYKTLIKQVTDLLPKDTNVEVEDGFDEF